MKPFVICKCFRFSLLVTTVISMYFAKASVTTETDMVPHKLDTFRKSADGKIGPVSALSRTPRSYDLTMTGQHTISVPSRRHLASCQLYEHCHNKEFDDCDFTGCQYERRLDMSYCGLWGRLPADLHTRLPRLEIL